MYKLYDKIPTYIWVLIADFVQELNIDNGSKEEFTNNLEKLNIFLDSIGVCSLSPKRFPKYIDEVGSASLLESIYASSVKPEYRKVNFLEQIYQLKELEIPYIQFMPICFPSEVSGLGLSYHKNGVPLFKNAITDGEFIPHHPEEFYGNVLNITNLKNANYVFNIILRVDKENVVMEEEETFVMLNNFNGKFPIKETFYDINIPGVYNYYTEDSQNKRQLVWKQHFITLNKLDCKLSRKLVKDKYSWSYK